MGLSAIFSTVPERETLTDEFVRNYYRYADQLFQIRQGEAPFTDVSHLGFELEIYASGEYSCVCSSASGPSPKPAAESPLKSAPRRIPTFSALLR